MRTKGVLLLGFIVCWIAVCNAEDGYLYDDGLEDSLSRELAEDKLFRAYHIFRNEEEKKEEEDDPEVVCTDDVGKCSARQKCVEKGDKKICKCADGLSGKDCQTLDWCENEEKFGKCKDSNGKCDFNEKENQFVCICADGKQWNDGEKTCEEVKCPKGDECGDREKCEEADADKICKCADGLSGFGCEKLEWCENPDKFQTCKDKNGKCEYDKDEKSVVCKCGPERHWDSEAKKCKKTCTKDEECADDQKCREKGDSKFCECADGLGGDDCSKTDWCEETGKFENCKGVNGTCKYNKEKRSVDCLCSDGKKIHNKDNICKVVECSKGDECGEKEKCIEEEGKKICKCADGLSGIGCETLEWCKDPAKFEKCNDTNGTCEYDKGQKSVVCTCEYLKKWSPDEKICKDTCFKDEDCADNEKCREKDGWKSCKCADGLDGDGCTNKAWCENGKFKNCRGSNGTCDYKNDMRSVVCLCDTGKKLHPTENRCRETCVQNPDCKYGGECVDKEGEDKFCSCKSGLIGDKCETVFDCTRSGKYKGCNASGGLCKYIEGKAVCQCDGNLKLHDQENICKETCSKNEDCKDNQICVENDGWKSCKCADGLGGDDCSKKVWCEGHGKFKNCKSSNGTCEYVKDKRSVDCLCDAGKKLHPTENRCSETCAGDNDCQNGGKCEERDGNKFCSCKSGTIGDKCQTVFDCSSQGKYKGCEKSGGNCTFDGSKAVCECSGNKALHDKENLCKECDCGPKGTCKFVEGKKTCECPGGFAEKGGKCRETCQDDDDCKNDGKCKAIGEHKFCECKTGLSGDKCEIVDECHKTLKDCKDERGTCEYDIETNRAICECHNADKKFNPAVNYCQETCSAKEECNGGECSGTEEKEGFCKCLPGQLEGDKCEIVIDCVRGKYSKCEDTGGECGFQGGKSTCKCSDEKKLDESSSKHICREKCSKDADCKNGAKCEKELCKCPQGTEGDDCGTVSACKTLKCEEKNANCMYNSSLTENTFCVCEDTNYIFVKHDEKCVEKCKPEGFCIHGGTCNSQTKLCDCKKNTKGEKCQDIIGCDTLKCPDKISECVYDINGMRAICKCNEPNHYFEKGQCKAEWCRDGCNLAVSTCKYDNGVGTCTCKSEGSYYDYTAKTCKKFDSCFNKTCAGDLICKNGNCDCPDNYRKNGTTCEKMNLCPSKCFKGAKCEEGISDGYVKCSCEIENKFYLARSKICEDGKCFLPDGRKDCKTPCPTGMTFKDGNCKYDKEETNCDKDCGFLGWCKKTGDKTECVCLTKYSEKDKKTDKCVLKASAVCPNDRDGDNKCKCTNKYKLSSNGITCELKSCSDEDVQKECKSIGATCVDNWKTTGYDCQCPKGYIKDTKKGCLDPCSSDSMKDSCSSNGQVCYIGDSFQVGDCRCPPTFTFNANSKSCDLGGDNTFMIRKLPVLKRKYESVGDNINEVTLNIDVKKSMVQAFRNLEFVHVFSFKVDKDVLLCDVWLQFKPNLDPGFNATLEVRRWKSHAVKGENEYLLPPELLLSSTDIDAASEEELTPCSPSVQQLVCGTGSSCADNKCTCAAGFREIESTLRQSSTKRIVRCEDIDECAEGNHNCKENSKCVNTPGSYFCKCNTGFKKEKGDAHAMDKEACVDLCHGNPCGKGTCQLTKEKNTIECTCQLGYTGSFCNKADVNLAKAGKATKVVGAVLGTLLAIVIVLIIVYIVRQRKNSYSEDFTPAPRVDNAEMVERRPMRGVTNRGYQ